MSSSSKRVSQCDISDISGAGTGIYLNFDLMIQVFVRLPIKSLVRFKSVCTSWNFLFSGLEFANLYQHHAVTNLKNNPFLQVFMYCRPNRGNLQHLFNFKIDSTELYNVLYKSDYWRCNFSKSADKLNHKFDVETYPIGSCNGLICFVVGLGYDTFYLWNPATQDSCCLKGHSLSQGSVPLSWGFGHDPLSDDYKIIVLGKLNDLTREPFAKVFSLRTNEWKPVECPFDHEMIQFMDTKIFWEQLRSLPVLVGASLYWGTRARARPAPKNILAFDLTRDLFEIIPLPKPDPSSFGHLTEDFFICQLRQSLYACWLLNECDPKDSREKRLYIKVWRMEGHGTEKVWKGVFRYRGLERCRSLIPLLPKLFELKEHGKYLISGHDFGQYLLIDPRGERCHPSIAVSLKSNFGIFEDVRYIFDYAPSLASPTNHLATKMDSR